MRLPAAILALIASWLIVAPAWAADSTTRASGLDAELPWGQLAGSLGLVLGLILLLAWLARRYGGVRGGGVPIRILGGQSLGARERVILIEVSGRRLLLGVAPGRVQTLSSWETGDTSASETEQVAAPDFQQWLGRALGRETGESNS